MTSVVRFKHITRQPFINSIYQQMTLKLKTKTKSLVILVQCIFHFQTHVIKLSAVVCDYYVIYWFGVDIAKHKILLVHIGGFCDHLFPSVHCDVTVVTSKN